MLRLTLSTIALIALTAVAPFESPALAWGPDGHRIVCRIAYQLLDGPHRDEIVRLSKSFKKPEGTGLPFFTDGCTFPDEARQKARDKVPGYDKFASFASWHFLNTSRSSAAIALTDCNDNCVLTGIAFHAAALATGADDQARAEALFFLGHWMGDIHQPLHVSYEDDLGGNNIKPISGGFYTSGHLHAVWDSGIINKADATDGWRVYADKLAGRITPAQQAGWLGTPALSWAQESYMVSTVQGAQYCTWNAVQQVQTCTSLTGPGRTLGEGYQAIFQDDVELRLQQAGTRLAVLLRTNMKLP